MSHWRREKETGRECLILFFSVQTYNMQQTVTNIYTVARGRQHHVIVVTCEPCDTSWLFVTIDTLFLHEANAWSFSCDGESDFMNRSSPFCFQAQHWKTLPPQRNVFCIFTSYFVFFPLHKGIKLTYFIIQNKKKVFFFTLLKNFKKLWKFK